ncbi:MAG: CDP-archaeol synthase [Firmicutes bacterium]|nr:CDP-archaeol synthase [Bacillota bacterium]
MRQRVLSAIVAFAIFIPIFVVGGFIFNITFYILTLIGLNEFMKVKEKEKKYPDFIRFVAYIMVTLFYFNCTLNGNLNLSFDYKMMSGLFLTLLLPVVLYHNEKVYNVKDAFYLLGGVFFLGFSMSLFYLYRTIGLNIIIFLFLITIITDSYAYFAGRLIGKNKLLEEISPKKTWEGTIVGSLIGTFVCSVYYLTVINPEASIFAVSVVVLFLTLVGQFGDLFFSAIKRKYKVKDFSNIMPGHGGVLDRLDSSIFVMLAFTFFLNIL